MAERIDDEETPLLASRKTRRTPLPWGQFLILLILQLPEPLTGQVIYPFAPQLIRDAGVTKDDEAKVGYYVGLMQSMFFATQALTVLHWSRMSDRFGRKPIVLIGLFGLSLSMYSLGLSTTYMGAVFSRSLNGALNGNIGVLKSMVAEITDSTNLAQAYAYLPIAWATGQAAGPAIGGYLSRPAIQYPDVFGNNEFLKRYPYFLACAVPATFSALCWVMTFLFLKETVPNPTSFRQFFFPRRSKEHRTESPNLDEVNKVDPFKPLPLKQILIPNVLISGGNYAILSLVDITLRSIQPVFFSTPIELGGLGIAPFMIGRILSVYGIFNGIAQIFFFQYINNRYGTKRVYLFGLLSAVFAFAMLPVINMLAKAMGGRTLLVWVAVACHFLSSIVINFSYGCVFIYICASSPNKASLGTVNGLAQVGVSIARTIGPALANSLFSISCASGYMGGYLVYFVLATGAALSLLIGDMLPAKPWEDDEVGKLGR